MQGAGRLRATGKTKYHLYICARMKKGSWDITKNLDDFDLEAINAWRTAERDGRL